VALCGIERAASAAWRTLDGPQLTTDGHVSGAVFGRALGKRVDVRLSQSGEDAHMRDSDGKMTGAMTDLDPNDFKSFRDVCKGLPGVKPRLLQNRLREALVRGEGLTLGAEQVTHGELRELFVTAYRGLYEVYVVSPKGARILVRLYRAGVLETPPKEVSTELLKYLDSEDALRAKAQARRDRERAYREKVENPESITESEFTFSLLNEVFWKQGLKGDSSMVLDGITVTKSVTPYLSNSGKSRDFRVAFSWVGRDGKRHCAEKPSIYEGNRRNDEERNFGLPE